MGPEKVVVPRYHHSILLVLSLVCVPGLATPLDLITRRDPSLPAPAAGNGDSLGAITSPDGRFVLFCSSANNLGVTTNGMALPLLNPAKLNVFLRDRTAGTVTLVSVNISGMGGGNGDSVATALSTNGRYACFESSASDLVNGDTNGLTDIFVRDVWSNTTVLVSVALDGLSAGNGVCRGSSMSPDGR